MFIIIMLSHCREDIAAHVVTKTARGTYIRVNNIVLLHNLSSYHIQRVRSTTMKSTSMESLAKVRVYPYQLVVLFLITYFFINGCSGCIPSNHHATVLEGSGGEGERERERENLC